MFRIFYLCITLKLSSAMNTPLAQPETYLRMEPEPNCACSTTGTNPDTHI